MFELGNVTNTLSGGSVFDPRGRLTPRSARLPSEGTAAVIQDPRGAEAAGRWFDADEPQSVTQVIKDMAAATREKLENLRELIESITASPFPAKTLTERLAEQAAQIEDNETSATHVYSDVSSLLSYFREAIEEIRSSEGFLIGVRDKIEKFIPQAEFELNQVGDVEEHMADITARLELGIFSLAHVREQALNALRGQEVSEQGRALTLFKDNAGESDTAKKALAEQTQSDEIDLMA